MASLYPKTWPSLRKNTHSIPIQHVEDDGFSSELTTTLRDTDWVNRLPFDTEGFSHERPFTVNG
jgi:hypothetical protein